jgi:hypothetical protein
VPDLQQVDPAPHLPATALTIRNQGGQGEPTRSRPTFLGGWADRRGGDVPQEMYTTRNQSCQRHLQKIFYFSHCPAESPCWPFCRTHAPCRERAGGSGRTGRAPSWRRRRTANVAGPMPRNGREADRRTTSGREKEKGKRKGARRRIAGHERDCPPEGSHRGGSCDGVRSGGPGLAGLLVAGGRGCHLTDVGQTPGGQPPSASNWENNRQ